MRKFQKLTGLLALVSGVVFAGLPAMLMADDGITAIPSASAEQILEKNDKVIKYAARWSEHVLKAEDGQAQATISATSYIKSDEIDAAARPVVFFFNGGPGASSSPLHFGALGPRRFQGKRQRGVVRSPVPNTESILDIADLVFIDPVGTGFSRALNDDVGSNYWSIEGDAGAVLSYIRAWLAANNRGTSPLYIAGESYGGFRLATMAPKLADLNVKGLILVSPMLDASGGSEAAGNDMPYVFSFPTMAVAAWHHGKSAIKASSEKDVWEKARQFAAKVYGPALMEGGLLSQKKKQKVAAEMAGWLGLPDEALLQANLRIGKQAFLEALMDDQNLLVGRLDTRVTAEKKPPANPDRPAAANDPSLGLGRSNVIVSAEIGQYLRENIGVETERDYNSLTLDVNFKWDWGSGSKAPRFYLNQAPLIAGVMAEKPDVRLLVLGGYYDLATPVMAAHYAVSHSGAPMDRVAMHMFPAGHSPFEGDANRARFAATIANFVTGH